MPAAFAMAAAARGMGTAAAGGGGSAIGGMGGGGAPQGDMFGTITQLSPLLAGISTYFKNRNARKIAKQEQKNKEELLKREGHENRKTDAYNKQLLDYYERKKEDDVRAGYANYTSFARAGPAPQSALVGRLLNTYSPEVARQSALAPSYDSYYGDPPKPTKTPKK